MILCGLVAVIPSLAAFALGQRRARLRLVVGGLTIAFIAVVAVLLVAAGGSPLDLWGWFAVHL